MTKPVVRFAPLTGGLLARKGEARPAMRAALPVGDADDLGWNDMGGVPVPVLQQAAIAASLDAVPEGVPATAGKTKAFTLRLAPERHARLRSACAATHISAQALITQALDRMLDTMPAAATPAHAALAEPSGKKARGAKR